MQQLSLQDEGYASGSNEDVPTPLCTTPCIQHISSLEHASFNPAHSIPCRPVTCTPTHSPGKSVKHHLSFNNDSVTCTPTHSPGKSVKHHLSFNDDSMDTSTSSSTSSPDSSDLEEEEDFQTVPLDDEFWSTEIVPEWKLCIHEDGLPNSVCSHPCPYGLNGTASYIDTLDLNDISDLEDHFLTTSDDEELPTLEQDQMRYCTTIQKLLIELWFRLNDQL